MLTVADALKFPDFANARVVAGRDGLNTPIVWVHNSSVTNAAQWLNGGELVLTTALNMPTDTLEQERYLHELIEKGVAGLVVTVGQMISHVPDYLCEIADAHAFPLIEIPYQVRFIDLARTINEHISQKNMAMVTRALHIQKALTQLVLENGGIRQLAETLAQLINHSISIEDARFEALVSVNIADVDEARRYTQQYGRTDPRLVQALEVEVLPQIRQTLRPVVIPQMPHVGLGMERILAPIVVHGEIYGYVWIIADDRPVSDIDHMAIESAATIAALMMLHQESIQNVEASLKGNLLTRLIQGKEVNGVDVLNDQALRYDVDLRQAYRVLVVEYHNITTKALLDLYRRINSVVTTHEYAAIVGQFAGQVIMLAQEAENIPILVDQIHAQCNPIRIGISASHQAAGQVSMAHAQCREVLEIMSRLNPQAKTVHFDDLGYLHVLYHAGPQALQNNPYVPGLRELRHEQQADLFHTLEVYLDVGGNGVQTAETLHIHRSTLNYRLQRITEVCRIDLSGPTTRMNLQVALKLMRLFED